MQFASNTPSSRSSSGGGQVSEALMTDYHLSLCISTIIVCLCPIARNLQGSWVAPGPVLAIVWSVATLVPLVISPDYPAYPEAYILALLFVVAGLVASSLPILMSGRRVAARPAVQGARAGLFRCAYWVALAFGGGAPAILHQRATGRFGSMEVTELASSVTEARYQGEFDMPLAATVLSSFIYFAAILGGYLTAVRHGSLRSKLTYLLFLIPMFGLWIILTTRAVFAFGGVLYLSGMIIGAIETGWERLIRIGLIVRLIVALMVLSFGLIYGGLLFRWGSLSAADACLALDYARIGLTGHMSVLGTWYALEGSEYSPPGYGHYTFAGVADKLGISDRKLGVFDVPVELQSGLSTNIYTVLRYLIEDFTVPGALLMFILLSLAAGQGVVALRAGRLIAATPLAIYLTFVLFSPITTAFAYNSIVVALALYAGMMSLGATRSTETTSPETFHA